jgi:hypothetical protein
MAYIYPKKKREKKYCHAKRTTIINNHRHAMENKIGSDDEG